MRLRAYSNSSQLVCIETKLRIQHAIFLQIVDVLEVAAQVEKEMLNPPGCNRGRQRWDDVVCLGIGKSHGEGSRTAHENRRYDVRVCSAPSASAHTC